MLLATTMVTALNLCLILCIQAAVSITQGTSRHRIEFLIGEHVLPYNMTVYEAVKQFSEAHEGRDVGGETDTDGENPYGNTGIWINTHTIW